MRVAKIRLLQGYFCGCLSLFAGMALCASAQTTAPNEWTWVGGSSGVGGNAGQSGVYGTLGKPASGNIPGGRNSASDWTDGSGNFWLFGGQGFDSTGLTGYLNDLWEFIPSTNEWTWMGGGNTLPGNYAGLPGVYGTLNTPSASNIPGSRWLAATWTDSSSNLWLFGGNGYDSTGTYGFLNDLWEFSPSSKEWTWMGGSDTAGQSGLYGTLGSPAAGNIPGGRFGAVSWVDSKGDLWLFGGNGLGSPSQVGELNDLWMFNFSTKEWAWMAGSDNANPSGVYGTMGKPGAGNVPPGLEGALHGMDISGNVWLFGGTVNDGVDDVMINDLWKFSPSASEWTWVGGSRSFPEPSVVYGTLGAPGTGNIPEARSYGASWTDATGNFWVFGGQNNDLWEFNPSKNEWTWMGGSYLTDSQPGVFGVLGTPNEENVPGSRNLTMSWTDGGGNFWLFGGSVVGAVPSVSQFNDLWKYQPSSAPNFIAVPTPVFSPAAGNYGSISTVTITDPVAAATIFYTTDGSTPTTSSTVYQGGIGVGAYGKPLTINAIAVASNFFNSAVGSVAYTFNPQDFSVAASPSSITVTGGQIGSTTVTVTPLSGFTSGVSFSCAGLPSGASCSFSPATVTPPGTTLTKLTVSTAATSAAIRRSSSPLLPFSTLAVALCCIGWKPRRRWQMRVLLAVSFAGLSLLSSCGSGGSSGATPVTSTVTIAATSGSLSHSTTFLLTVN
jgi:N-acetylneuraminic acid mutarotase